jgi:cytidylate kinase
MRDDLVGRAFQRQEVDRQLAVSMEEEEKLWCLQCPVPVIAVSRELGAGGTDIAKLVAQELDFAYYDRELIDEVAEQLESDREHVERQETGPHDAVSDILLSFMDRRHVPDTVYLRSLVRVLHRVAQEGRVVIVGRGAGCVLSGALRVRIVAPVDVRVERIARLRQLDEKEARHAVRESDQAQTRFLRAFFGCGANDVYTHDLIINTTSMSIEHGAELIITRVRQTWKDEA